MKFQIINTNTLQVIENGEFDYLVDVYEQLIVLDTYKKIEIKNICIKDTEEDITVFANDFLLAFKESNEKMISLSEV